MADVLVVDDEPDIAESYEMWLQEDHDVEMATSGEAALEALDESIDVLLLDRRMPEMSGDEVLRALADRPADPTAVLVTAVDPGFDIVDLEFDTYITKPVTGSEVVEVVEGLTGRAEYREPSGESSWPPGTERPN